jgi:hypothetical protein
VSSLTAGIWKSRALAFLALGMMVSCYLLATRGKSLNKIPFSITLLSIGFPMVFLFSFTLGAMGPIIVFATGLLGAHISKGIETRTRLRRD